MNQWALSDWANAWKSPIPTKVKDNNGIEVSLSEKDIQSIKAQLAIQNFKEIINSIRSGKSPFPPRFFMRYIS